MTKSPGFVGIVLSNVINNSILIGKQKFLMGPKLWRIKIPDLNLKET